MRQAQSFNSGRSFWNHERLLHKTISKPTNSGSHSEKKDVKITNKEVLVSLCWVLVPDKCCILHQTQKIDLFMLETSSRLVWDILVSAALNILIHPGPSTPPYPPYGGNTYFTHCDVMKIDFSRGGCFPSAGSGLREEELSSQCCSVHHFNPKFHIA